MSSFRIAGVAVAIGLALYAVLARRRGVLKRGDLLITLLLALGIGGLSINPAWANWVPRILRLENRLFAVLVIGVLSLVGMFLFLLTRINRTRDELAGLVRMMARTEYLRAHQDDVVEGDLLAIVMPAYREERTIGTVLSSLPSELFGYRVLPIVVVDGSYDETEFVARSLGHRVATHVVNRGQGGALRTGFDIALAEGADIVVTMDADGQHTAEDLPELIQPVAEGRADYVMGSRFAGEYEDKGGARHVGIVFFSHLISFLTGERITDCTNGFRAIRAEALRGMDLREERFNAPELIMQAAENDLRIMEIPVRIQRRAQGDSRKPRHLGYPVGFLLAMIKTWLR